MRSNKILDLMLGNKSPDTRPTEMNTDTDSTSTPNSIDTIDSNTTNSSRPETKTTPNNIDEITKHRVNYKNKGIIENQLNYINIELNKILAVIFNLSQLIDSEFFASIIPSDTDNTNSERIKIIKKLFEYIRSDIATTCYSIKSANGTNSLEHQFSPSEFIDFCHAIYKPRIRHLVILLHATISTRPASNDFRRKFLKFKNQVDEKGYSLDYPVILFSQQYYNPDLKDYTKGNESKGDEKSTVSYRAAALVNPLHINNLCREPLEAAQSTLQKDTTELTIEIYPGRCHQDDKPVSYFAVNNRTYAQHCIRGIPPRFVPIMPTQDLINRLSNENSHTDDPHFPFGSTIQPERSKLKYANHRYDTEMCGLELLYKQNNPSIQGSNAKRLRIHIPNQPFSLENLLNLGSRMADNVTEKETVTQHVTSSSTGFLGMFYSKRESVLNPAINEASTSDCTIEALKSKR